MPIGRAGGGGGAGFALGPPTNTFGTTAGTAAAARTLRETYETANADWLAQYDANGALMTRLLHTGTPGATFEVRAAGEWVTITAAIAGPTGPGGTAGENAAIESLYQATADDTAPSVDDSATGWSALSGITDDLPYLWRIQRSGTVGNLPAWSTITPVLISKIPGGGGGMPTGVILAVGWSSDTTIDASELAATSETTSIEIPAGTGGLYLLVWTADSQGEVSSISIAGGSNSRSIYGSDTAITLGGIDGTALRSDSRRNAGLLGEEILTVEF